MDTPTVIALITGATAVICSLIAAGASIYSVRVSLGNRAVMKVVESHTNGLLAKAQSDATARGVETGHAAGVRTGLVEGRQQGIDQAAADRSRE